MAESARRRKQIFLEVVELPLPERPAFLDRECGGDEALRRDVDALLQANVHADSFLEKPAAVLGATVDAEGTARPAPLSPGEEIGRRIGPYKLLEQIGEGGMGVVYMADQQEPVRRLVALKIIKPGMDSGQILARFEAERQALALMDHPNIAKVLDAGATADGRPYFVMELVKGTPITTFCDANKIAPRQRLELFIRVCQAIQHAHQKGVIHRDIKPSNVLVALYDEEPVPKVIDFGIAKAAGQVLTDKTLQTGFGAIVGTLEYMSPEQTKLNQLDVDTRSDIYSLGVLLYELLTGTTPLGRERIKEQAMLEVLRLIHEEEPARPSVKLSSNQGRASISTHGTEPEELSQLFRGELDWIVMKSLEKDRNRRYETAASLARDVERYLKDDLVEARPPSLGYRLQKALRKNRGPVIAASVVLLVLVGGVVGTTLAMLRALNAESKTRDANEMIQANLKVVERLNDDVTTALKISEANENKAKDGRIRAENLAKEAAASEKSAKHQTLVAETARHALQIDQAYRACQRHDFVEAEKVLASIAKPFQEVWETRHVRDLCRRSFRPVGEFRKRPTPIAISADGKWLVMSSDDNTLTLWNLATNGPPVRLKKFKEAINHVAISADAKRIVAGSSDKTASVFDQAGKLLHTVPCVAALALSADGKHLVTMIDATTLKLWDAETGKEKRSCNYDGQTFGIVAVNADGRFVAASDGNNSVVWETATGKALEMTDLLINPSLGKISNPSRGLSIALSPDGKAFISSSSQLRHPAVWDVQTGKLKFFLRSSLRNGFDYQVRSVAYSGDGQRIVAGDDTGRVQAWNATTGLRMFSITSGYRSDMTGSPPRPLFPGCNRQLNAVAISGDGRRIVVSSGLAYTTWQGLIGGFEPQPGEMLVKVWDEETTQEKQLISATASPGWEKLESRENFTALRFSADGRRLVALADNGGNLNSWKVWNTETGQELSSRECDRDKLFRQVTLNAEGSRVLALEKGEVARVWDAATGMELPAARQEVPVKTISAFDSVTSEDGSRIFTLNPVEAKLSVRDALTNLEVFSFPVIDQPSRDFRNYSLAISLDGRRLAVSLGGQLNTLLGNQFIKIYRAP